MENSVILGFLFPGVTIIIFAGFVVRTLNENLALVVLIATLGAFLGDNLDYFLGVKLGWVLKNKPLFSKPINLVEPFLKKHGVYAVFIGRFSGWSRAWVALTCGVTQFSYTKFLAVSFFSALVWTTIWIILGYLLGGNQDLIEKFLSQASILAWVGFTLVLIYYFKTRIRLFLELVAYTSKRYGVRLKNKINR